MSDLLHLDLKTEMFSMSDVLEVSVVLNSDNKRLKHRTGEGITVELSE